MTLFQTGQSPTHSQKPKSKLMRLAMAVALAVPLFLISDVSNDLQHLQCTSSSLADAQIAQSCILKHSANNSWFAWATGSSRSTQFQFIDLIELVHGDEGKSRKTVITKREG
ncbi:MAG: hypothetical protein ACI8WB_004795 [Phenylobacterium sp.]|jgi:hypothetical protein